MAPTTTTPMTADELHALVTKWKAIHTNAILNVNLNGDTIKQPPKIAPSYDIELELHPITSTDNRYITSIDNLGHPVDDYALAVVTNTGKASADGNPPYQNYIHTKGKAILCMSNFAEYDQLFGKSDRLYWSDLMAACFSNAMAEYNGDLKGLAAIWRIKIVNQVTKQLIQTICKGLDMEFGPKNDEFYALLATDHDKGPARMLSTYPHIFGRRFMTRIPWYFRWDELIDLGGTNEGP
ncbi:hypothetical protein J3F84DRAFT_352706 [Trichoderma pleuroticola]